MQRRSSEREESAMSGIGACAHRVFTPMNIYRSLLPLVARRFAPRSTCPHSNTLLLLIY